MKILISQNAPSNTAVYSALEDSFGVKIDFIPFFLIEPLSSLEFRAQRINIAEYTAIVFSSRHAIDAFFKISEDLRIKIPETLKYFCTTEIVAMYLQKHIVYRKRKIFFGDGTTESIITQIGTKHKGEKFLITSTEGSNTDSFRRVFQSAGLDFTIANFVKPVSQDIKSRNIGEYDLIVLYNPSDVKSLFESYPDYKPGNTKFISFGKSIVNAMKDAGLDADFQAPTPEAPSVSKALEIYLKTHK